MFSLANFVSLKKCFVMKRFVLNMALVPDFSLRLNEFWCLRYLFHTLVPDFSLRITEFWCLRYLSHTLVPDFSLRLNEVWCLWYLFHTLVPDFSLRVTEFWCLRYLFHKWSFYILPLLRKPLPSEKNQWGVGHVFGIEE